MDLFLPSLAFIGDLAGPEMMFVFVLVLLLFGGDKLPQFARGLGKSIREFKKAAAGVEDEFKRALEEDEHKSTMPPPLPKTFPPYPPASIAPAAIEPPPPEAGFIEEVSPPAPLAPAPALPPPAETPPADPPKPPPPIPSSGDHLP